MSVKATEKQGKKRRTRDELKADIIAAGTELFAEQGYSGPSIRAIAKQADVALPALYRFFVNKHDLYVQCCKQSLHKDLDFLNNDSAVSTLTGASAEAILYVTTLILLRRQSSKDVPHMVSRALFDGDAELIRSEAEKVFNSKFFQVTVKASGELCGEDNAVVRLASLHCMVFSFQPIFSFWEPFFRIKPSSGKLEARAVAILQLVYQGLPWQSIADEMAGHKLLAK
jgi:AcrR family transcriptional regulator